MAAWCRGRALEIMKQVKMDLIIAPADLAPDTLLASSWYNEFWKNNHLAIVEAFLAVTRLSFQQQEIIVNVRPGTFATAGNADNPMILPGDFSSDEERLLIVMHELGHRLLGGNALSPIGLGLIHDAAKIDDDQFQLFEHRHLYLFLYDVIEAAFGRNIAKACEKYSLETADSNYIAAWRWAMNMNKGRRKYALSVLSGQALTREQWHRRDSTSIRLRDPVAWFESLAGATA